MASPRGIDNRLWSNNAPNDWGACRLHLDGVVSSVGERPKGPVQADVPLMMTCHIDAYYR